MTPIHLVICYDPVPCPRSEADTHVDHSPESDAAWGGAHYHDCTDPDCDHSPPFRG